MTEWQAADAGSPGAPLLSRFEAVAHPNKTPLWPAAEHARSTRGAEAPTARNDIPMQLVPHHLREQASAAMGRLHGDEAVTAATGTVPPGTVASGCTWRRWKSSAVDLEPEAASRP